MRIENSVLFALCKVKSDGFGSDFREAEGGFLSIDGPRLDEPICIIHVDPATQTRYDYHMDGLGGVIALSDSSGAAVESYSCQVFGNVIIRDGLGNVISQTAYENPYLFTGRRFDDQTGLYYYRARMYSPALGRFLQTDPIGYYDSMNLYQYCMNNPVNWIDPLGLCKGHHDFVYLTDEYLEKEIEKAMGEHVEAFNWYQPWELVNSPDTDILAKPKTIYVYDGKFYQHGQVNYIGVGAGSAYHNSIPPVNEVIHYGYNFYKHKNPFKGSNRSMEEIYRAKYFYNYGYNYWTRNRNSSMPIPAPYPGLPF